MLLAACAPAPASSFTAAHKAAVVDSVKAMLDAWHAAFAALDFDRVASFYSTDSAFRWIEDGQLRYRSNAAILKEMRAVKPTLKSLDFTLGDLQISPLAPGVAIVTSQFEQKMTDTAGKTFGFAGAMSFTVVHADSGWRFLVGHASIITDRPAPVPEKPQGR